MATEFRPLRHAPLPDSKRYNVNCDVCEGRGRLHDCPDCDCECDECDGSGELTALEELSVDINGTAVQAEYARLLQALPDLLVATTTATGAPLAFKFCGGDGLVMPLHHPRKIHIAEPPSLSHPDTQEG